MEYMKKAVKKAKEGMKQGQAPFGACIVKDGKVISCAHNTVWADKDPTAHAEVNAIRKACKKIKDIDLSGCTLYTTTEPCPMCFSAIHWAKIDKIVYGATIADAKKSGFNELTISNKKMKELGKSKVKIEKVKREECKKLFEKFKGKTY